MKIKKGNATMEELREIKQLIKELEQEISQMEDWELAMRKELIDVEYYARNKRRMN